MVLTLLTSPQILIYGFEILLSAQDRSSSFLIMLNTMMPLTVNNQWINESMNDQFGQRVSRMIGNSLIKYRSIYQQPHAIWYQSNIQLVIVDVLNGR